MKVITDIKEYKKDGFVAISLGMFDGVHLGHCSVLSILKKIAQEKNLQTLVYSFWPHPRKLIQPECKVKLLNTSEEKVTLLENQNIDFLYLQKFDNEFKNKEAEDFVKEILVKKLKTKCIIIGHDHRFGKDKKGDFKLLEKMGREFGFEVHQIDENFVDNHNISSTLIREALQKGNIREANKLLGYPYTISGEVVDGKKLGRTIGYPTANILVDEEKILPKKGAYIVEVELQNIQYKGMLSIGTNPTVGGGKLTVEVYILDFNQNIYGEKLTVRFRDFLHEEIKFESLEALVHQLDKDKKTTENYSF